MVLEEVSLSRGEPTLVSKAAIPERTDLPPADLESTSRRLIAHCNQMVDMMLTGPLAFLCSEECLALHQCFTGPSSPKR